MARNTFSSITEAQIKKASIATLADRPNSISRYGDGGLSAQELKERFDAFPALAQKKINEIIEALASSDAAKYITLADNLTGKDNLYDFIMLFIGASESKENIADYIYALYTYRNETSSESKNLQEIFDDIASRVSGCESNNETLVGFVADHEERITSNEEVVEVARTELPNITTAIENHEERISGIEQYLGGDNFIVDDSTAYEKTVPKNACEKAKVLSVGGMTYKSDNLLPYHYTDTTKTVEEITFTDNGDGSIAITGTSTGRAVFRFATKASIKNLLTVGNTYKFVDYGKKSSDTNVLISFFAGDEIITTVSDGVSKSPTFTIPTNADKWSVYIELKLGATVNYTMYPQIQHESNQVNKWSSYYEGLRHAKVTEIKSGGANIWDEEWYNASLNEHTGVFTEASTANVSSKNYISVLPNTQYYQSLQCWIAFYDKNKAFISASAFSVGGFTTPSNCYFMKFQTLAGKYGLVYKNDIIIAKGTEAVPYRPYVGTIDTFTIPETVQARKGYGLGVPNAVSNLIEFRGGRVFELNQCEEIVVDGVNVKFDVASTANGYRYFAITLPKVAYDYNSLVASHFEVSYKLEPGYAYLSGSPRNLLACYFIDQTMTTKEEANAYAAERYNSGNPIKFVVAYETVEVTDITDSFTHDNLISVEGGGTITAVNEHKLAAPSSIKYLVTYPKEV